MKKGILKIFIVLGSFWILSHLSAFVLRRVPEPIGSRADLFIDGAETTLYLTIGAGLMGLLVGLLAGLGKLSSWSWARLISSAFIWLIRGTPLLVQILFAYYAIPALLPWLQINEFSAALLALSLNVGAYNAEVIRAGILAVPKGQTEAARSLGLSQTKTMRWIVMPQAIQIVTPPLINNMVALLKDSSLASSIGLLELSLAGNRVSSETFLPVPVLTTTAVLYLFYTTVITALADFLEKGGLLKEKHVPT